MSLLSESFESMVMMDKTRAPDGEGGFITTWVEGAPFSAAVVFNSTMEARVAQVQGVKSLYTVTTRKNIKLEYHDVFRRVRDGKVFRVTSDGDDSFTPEKAHLNMRQVTAEEWIPT